MRSAMAEVVLVFHREEGTNTQSEGELLGVFTSFEAAEREYPGEWVLDSSGERIQWLEEPVRLPTLTMRKAEVQS